MAQVTIPDELARRVQSRLQGEDLDTFTARAINEMLSFEEDPLVQTELTEKTRLGLKEAAAGRVAELLPGMRDLAKELGIRFNR